MFDQFTSHRALNKAADRIWPVADHDDDQPKSAATKTNLQTDFCILKCASKIPPSIGHGGQRGRFSDSEHTAKYLGTAQTCQSNGLWPTFFFQRTASLSFSSHPPPKPEPVQFLLLACPANPSPLHCRGSWLVFLPHPPPICLKTYWAILNLIDLE